MGPSLLPRVATDGVPPDLLRRASPDERAKQQAEWNADLAAHWKVESGVIVNDGKGVFLTTDRDHADFELVLEWMFPQPCGDSGIYLRGQPQVQLWDPACERDFKHGCQKGSGGLWNSPAGSGPGWRDLGEADFENANCAADTWTWRNGTARCTGKLPPGGIEVQVLDHGYTEQYEQQTGKKADWFRTDGDVFPVGSSDMRPFPPVAPNGKRSFPAERRSRGTPEWNQYYVRAVNGEVRLWVTVVRSRAAPTAPRPPASCAWSRRERRSNSAT